MKKLLWILGTIVVAGLWFVLVGFMGVGINVAINIATRPPEPSLNTNLFASVIGIGWVFLIILSVLLWRRFKFRCHACKRWAALELVKSKVAKQEKISVLMEMEHRDLQGNVTGYHDQYIPGKRKTYQDAFKCKHCGNLETRIRTTRSASL